MSARSRVAFATGVAGLAGATLLITGRFDASVVVALLFVGAARVAGPASMMEAGPAGSVALSQQAWFTPTWALIVAVGAMRAGSPALSDARGANAVAGLAITHGEVLAVAGVWLAVAAGIIAIVTRTSLEAAPPTLQRLEIGATLGQAAFLVTLFAGPQISGGIDVVPWVTGIGFLAALAWRARYARIPHAPLIAVALAAVALGATIAGGAP